MSASTPARRALAGALLVALMAGACTTSVPLPTYSLPSDQGIGGSCLVGTLMAGEGTACVQLVAPGQSAVALLWPSGFTAKANPLRIYNPQGSEVAAEGDTVTAGGVFVDKWSIVCKTQGYFEVLQIIRGAPSFAP